MNSESVIDKSSSSTEQKEVDPIGYQLTTILLFFFFLSAFISRYVFIEMCLSCHFFVLSC